MEKVEAIWREKTDRVRAILREMGSVLVAYSGGVDSTLVLYLAHQELGDKALGVTGDSPSMPRKELEEALELASRFGARVEVAQTDEMEDINYTSNPFNRCYFCKTELFSRLTVFARARGYEFVVDGANAEDAGDFRPGLTARDELGARSPLQEAGLTKDEVRQASKAFGLPTWDKPAMACLSSRFPYGEEITSEKLRRVEEAEDFLRSLGFREVRVRSHGDIARIELDAEGFERMASDGLRQEVANKLKGIGFAFVALDLEGYRSGRLNERIVVKSPQ